MFRKLTEDADGQWKIYLSQTGLLHQVAILIGKVGLDDVFAVSLYYTAVQEINHLQHLEESTLNSDLSQGYALKMLTGKASGIVSRHYVFLCYPALLQSFLQVDLIKQQYKSQLVGTVLNGYLSLKR